MFIMEYSRKNYFYAHLDYHTTKDPDMQNKINDSTNYKKSNHKLLLDNP